jgi:hypothetical protein
MGRPSVEGRKGEGEGLRGLAGRAAVGSGGRHPP